MASTSPPLSVGERFGLLFIVEASSLSASAVLVLLSYLVVRQSLLLSRRGYPDMQPVSSTVLPRYEKELTSDGGSRVRYITTSSTLCFVI